MASLATGTVNFWYWWPGAWPPPRRGKAAQINLDNGISLIEFNSAGQVTASLVTKSDEIVRSVTSCAIISEHLNPRFMITATWDGPALRLFVNGMLLASTESSEALPSEFVFAPPPTFSRLDEFKDENAKAHKDRKGRMGGTHPKHGRERSSDEYILAGLRGEYLQVRDLLEHVHGGAYHHVPGLAGHLRTLIADSKQPAGGLLQWCAAMLDLPLILYVRSGSKGLFIGKADVRPPEDGLHRGLETHLNPLPSLTPHGQLQEPVDLDIWLGMIGAKIGDKVYTNRQLLHHIGSTIAQHFDVDQHPVVNRLKTIVGSDKAGNAIDTLAMRTSAIAEIVMGLCDQVLAKKNGTSP